MATHQPAEPSLGRGAGPAGRRLAAVVAAGFLADLPAPSRDPGEIHRAVNEVLARREFRSAAQPLLDRIWTWIVTTDGEHGGIDHRIGGLPGDPGGPWRARGAVRPNDEPESRGGCRDRVHPAAQRRRMARRGRGARGGPRVAPGGALPLPGAGRGPG